MLREFIAEEGVIDPEAVSGGRTTEVDRKSVV